MKEHRLAVTTALFSALIVAACASPANTDAPGTETAVAAHVMTQLAPTATTAAMEHPATIAAPGPTPPPPAASNPTPPFNPFQNLTPEQEACLRQAWGDEAYQAITGFQRPPGQDESPAMDACLGVHAPAGPGGPLASGPYSHQVMLARSSDGVNWQADEQPVRDHASVPEIVRLNDGTLMIYFVNGESDTTDAIRQRPDGSWEELDLIIKDMPSQKAWDPDVVLLPDGRLRLFFFGPPQNPTDKSRPHVIYSAVSTDGLTFEAEPGERISIPEVTDPSVVVLPDGSWLMALSRGQETMLAASANGQSFTLTGVTVALGGVPELFVLKDGSLRLFVTGTGIRSLASADGGKSWVEEPGDRLNASGNIAADPSVIQLSETSWLMAWKRINPEMMPSGPPDKSPKPAP